MRSNVITLPGIISPKAVAAVIIHCYLKKNFFFNFLFCHIYPPFTRMRTVSLYFGRDVRTRLVVAISKLSEPPVFRMKSWASC